MESLSDVLKSMTPSERLRRAEKEAEALWKDATLLKWRAKNPDLGDAELRLHMNVLYQYVREHKHCSRCPGLDRCPNDFTGHYTMLASEDTGGTVRLYDYKVACKKLLARQAQEAVRRRIRSFYVDEATLEQSFAEEQMFDLDPTRAPAVGHLLAYVDRTKEKGLQPKGLYLHGGLGTGKTFLMCYMLHKLAMVGMSGVIVYMPDFCEDLKAMFGEPQKLKESIDVLKETDLLVLDDIGAENMNPWLRDHVLGTILNYRMNRKPTFFTSNYDLEGLEQHLSFTSREGEEEFKGRRIMDRIRPFIETLEVQGFNKRNR